MHLLPRPHKTAGEELILNVRRVEAGPGARKEPDRRRSHHQRAAARQCVGKPGVSLPQPTPRDLVQGVGAPCAIDDARVAVILQILADPRQIVHHRHAVLLQQFTRPDPGKLQ